jgi:hypothetical protein
MTDIEHFEIWKSKKEFPNQFTFVSLSDEWKQLLKIQIEEIGNDIECRTFQIEFKNPAFYRVCDEGMRLRTLHDVGTYRDLAVSSNSELLKWFHEESYGTVIDSGLLHYVICCEDVIIDVLSYFEGAISIIEQ